MNCLMLFCLFIVFSATIEEANGFASLLNCGQIARWLPGAANGFGDPRHASTYSAGSATSCGITISPASTTYAPGQTFTVSIKSSAVMGYKVESTQGAWSGPSSGGRVQGKCVDYDAEARTSATMTFTAPASGTVQLRVLCAKRAGVVLTSLPITLTLAGPPATASPFTLAPTRPGETRSPTVQATPAPIVDPNNPEEFTTSLAGTLLLNYKVNETHAKFRMTQATAGYLSIGTGLVMVGSTVIVGMDPAANPGFPAVGLYQLLNEDGRVTGDIMKNVAISKAELATFGVSDTSFSIVNGETTLKFCVELTKQQDQFRVVTNDGSPVSIIFAGGPDGSNCALCNAANGCFLHDDLSFGTVPQINFALAPGETTGGEPAIPLSDELMIHIVTMLLGWGFFIPLGVVIPLFNNIKYSMEGHAFCGISGPKWVKYHWVLTLIGLILTYVGTLTGYNEVGKGEHFVGTHEALGLFLLVASIIQPIYAAVRPSRKTTKPVLRVYRIFFDYGHPSFGYFITYLAIYENIIGIDLLEKGLSGINYSFAGLEGKPGLGGTMGLFTLGLSIVFVTLLTFGLFRAGYTRTLKHLNGGSSEAITGYNGMADDGPQKPGGGKKLISMDELASHNNDKSCWMVYNGKVYDVTAFLGSHPGGKKVMMPLAGKDMTKGYNDAGHSSDANGMLPRYYIGELSRGRSRTQSITKRVSQKFNEMRQYVQMPEGFSSVRFSQAVSRFSSIPEGFQAAMNKQSRSGNSSNPQATGGRDSRRLLGAGDNQQRRRVTLTDRFQISHNTFYLKFSLPNPQVVLGLPTGKHIAIYCANTYQGKVKGKWNGQPDPEAAKKEIQRKFTPISNDEMDIGSFSLVVKVYRPSPQFPDGGRMSRYLESLRVGQTTEIAGPFGTHEYVGRGRFIDSGNELLFTEVALIAGGSGITPVLQIASAMLRDTADRTKIALLYSNSSVDDILMKDHLDELERRFPSRFKVWYTVSKDPQQSGSHYSYNQWRYSTGRITKQMLQSKLPGASRNAVAIQCGPKPMMENVNKLLKELGFSEDRIIEY